MPYVAFCALLTLLDTTLSVRPAEPSPFDRSPRYLASWQRAELDLLRALMDHGVKDGDIAHILQRTSGSIPYQREGSRTPGTLTGYPMVPGQLSTDDVKLLRAYKGLGLRDPLHWAYGGAASPEWLSQASGPTLRVIEVEPDPLTADWQPHRTAPAFWQAYRLEADMAAQAVWMDLAAQVVQSGRGSILIPGEDPHHAERDALRAALKRVIGQPATKSSVQTLSEAAERNKPRKVALLHRPELWDVNMIAQIKAPILLAVLPRLLIPEAEVRFNVYMDFNDVKNYAKSKPYVLPYLLRDNHPPSSTEEQNLVWLKQARLDAAWQERWIERTQWPADFRGDGMEYRSYRRQLERYRHRGLLNTRGIPARLDWRFLSHLPGQGRVIAASHELYVRALVWHVLTTGRWPSDPILQGESSKWLVALTDREQIIIRRVLQDLPQTGERPASQLQFVVGQVAASAYIG